MQAFENIAHELRTQGFSLCAGFLAPAAVEALRAEMTAATAEFRTAGIGRDRDFQQNDNVRADRIRWLESQAPAQRNFLQHMDALRLFLNQRLLLGLFDYEAHFAQYAPGAFYRKHRDTFSATNGSATNGASARDGKPRRVLSSVTYLNDGWSAGDGGELVVYDDQKVDADAQELLRVLPMAGSAIFFLSEEFPHEVLPAARERHSIAGWFRTRS